MFSQKNNEYGALTGQPTRAVETKVCFWCLLFLVMGLLTEWQKLFFLYFVPMRAKNVMFSFSLFFKLCK